MSSGVTAASACPLGLGPRRCPFTLIHRPSPFSICAPDSSPTQDLNPGLQTCWHRPPNLKVCKPPRAHNPSYSIVPLLANITKRGSFPPLKPVWSELSPPAHPDSSSDQPPQTPFIPAEHCTAHCTAHSRPLTLPDASIQTASSSCGLVLLPNTQCQSSWEHFSLLTHILGDLTWI